MVVVSFLKDNTHNSHPYDCRLMMITFARIRLDYAYREANFCADMIAKKGGLLDFLVDGGNMNNDFFFMFESPFIFVS